ncbi:uncharacterized protein LOC116214630 [Punica granatum]|uniref:Uncharacterized protein LOC116214630 n=2 Tax=Punica granatum TaxID=22663 RepID=A0A6P8E7D1_PUNGR|nr:uncharacterized protein LOC116214630 [Punica granatum]XP_031405895.1 uncharacterized protein LOC116214630 [Punica granatum]OWM78481.1 hypothetical protein CDL15_Pgr016205 [Punica granatum]PKI68742.1 hypothetical protein CRG98_010799 [Punica granatum]
MSPASKSKSKSKDKPSARAAKEQKAASKPSVPTNTANTANGSSASAYNPVSGTFHLLEASSAASSPPSHGNGRFQNIDDSDDHSSSPHGTVSEYDSVSNNGSCSGESEDLKEKAASSAPQSQREATTAADSDRREKIRLKNERKHQRQRERRAQELHEKCCGYMMSRKLESLSQQLVNMGFSSERATLALILNEGRVEDSVSWLFEGSQEEDHSKETDLGNWGNLKIDISEELALVSQLEAKYKCSKQEVERAIVTCEGDLVKAEESLRVQKQDKQATPSKQEATSDPKSLLRLQEKPTAASVMMPQRRSSERDLNYTRTAMSTPSDSELGLPSLQCFNGNPNHQALRMERRWPNSGSIPSLPSTIGMPQVSSLGTKSEVFHSVGDNQHSAVREPVIMMQRHQTAFPRQIPALGMNTSPSVSAGFFPNDNSSGIEMLRSNMKFLHSQRLGSLGRENQGAEPFYHQFRESSSAFGPFDRASEMGSSWNAAGRSSTAQNIPLEARGLWGPLMVGASPPSLAAPPSLGLFSSWGSSGSFSSNSQVDWHTGGLVPELDYTSIDWTLDSSLLGASKGSGLWLGLSSLLRDGHTSRMDGDGSRARFSGWQDNGVVGSRDPAASSGGLRDWTSPFAGKDIFSLPRQYVTSPSP